MTRIDRWGSFPRSFARDHVMHIPSLLAVIIATYGLVYLRALFCTLWLATV